MVALRTLFVDEKSIRNATWEQVEAALQLLNNETQTSVDFHCWDSDVSYHLRADGGRDERVVVSYLDDRLQRWSIARITDAPGKQNIALIAFGQLTNFPIGFTLEKSQAVEIFWEFYHHQELSQLFYWDFQSLPEN